MTKTLLSLACLLAATNVSAALLNGGFESGGTSPWISMGSAVATGATNVGPGVVSPFAGAFAARLITTGATAANLAATMGVTEGVLEASNGGLNATNGSMIYQSTAANAGDSFTFKWNFVEHDYLPFDDWAFYGVRLNGGPTNISKFASLATVGPSAGSTIAGWQSVTVNITQTGNYTFYFGVVNALDTGLNSELWIDGVSGSGSLGNAVPEPAYLGLLGLGLLGLARRRKA